MSAMMSATFSIPTERRMKSGVTPVASCSSSDSCWWVVDAGWMTSVLASPDIGQVGQELHVVDELDPGFLAALDAEADDGAGALGQVLLRLLELGAPGRPG